MGEVEALTKTLGGEWRHGYGTAPCPVCQTERRRDQRALSLTGAGSVLLVHCHKSGCSFRDILDAAGHVNTAGSGCNPEQDARQQSEYQAAQLKKARALWEQSQPIEGTQGEAYLLGRGITCELPASLRWTSNAYHGPSGHSLSAMIGHVSTGAIHRTFFDEYGVRLAQNAKMMQGTCHSGAVHLSNDDGPLVVCEGIETGLSLLSGLVAGPAAVWAALSAPGMKALELPKSIGELIVATDGDQAGEDAGQSLAQKAHRQGWRVSMLPAPQGQDWNDVLRERAAA